MDIISGIKNSLPEGMYSELSIYRHEVFVEMLGWELNAPTGYEQDQFDRSDTIYVVARGNDDRIVGCARLLPTTKPYLLGEVFPELLNGLSPPNSPDIWELSRFAAVDARNSTNTGRVQYPSSGTLCLLRSAIQTAASLGAKRLISVSPIGMERLLRNSGFSSHRAGPPMIVDGHPIFACWIDIDATALCNDFKWI